MAGKREVLALDTPTLLKLLKIAPSTLNYWVSRGFCHPTLDVGKGKRATRYWTVEDLLVLRAIKELRAVGCSLQLVGVIESRLRTTFEHGVGTAVLYYDGKNVLVDDEGSVVSLIGQLGQAVFVETVHITAFRLAPWAAEGAKAASLVDIEVVRTRRAALLARRASA